MCVLSEGKTQKEKIYCYFWDFSILCGKPHKKNYEPGIVLENADLALFEYCVGFQSKGTEQEEDEKDAKEELAMVVRVCSPSYSGG
jgi:hypothetical protein